MEFQQRQVSRMRSEISDYRAGRLSLNSLIGNIEGLARALDEEFWGDEVFPIVLALEQTNIDLLTPVRRHDKLTPWGCGKKLGLVKQQIRGSCDVRWGCGSQVRL